MTGKLACDIAYDRYKLLSEPCEIRRGNLQETLTLHQFYLDVQYELLWIQEKKPIAQSSDLGSSLTAVQNLVKKHQVTYFSNF